MLTFLTPDQGQTLLATINSILEKFQLEKDILEILTFGGLSVRFGIWIESERNKSSSKEAQRRHEEDQKLLYKERQKLKFAKEVVGDALKEKNKIYEDRFEPEPSQPSCDFVADVSASTTVKQLNALVMEEPKKGRLSIVFWNKRR